MLVFSRTKAALILGVCLLGFALSIPSILKPGTLPSWIPQPHVNLGLDLQGGSYLLLEVDIEALLKEKLANTRVQIMKTLTSANIRGQQVNVQGKSIAMVFQSPEQAAAARRQCLRQRLRAARRDNFGRCQRGRHRSGDCVSNVRSQCKFWRTPSSGHGKALL